MAEEEKKAKGPSPLKRVSDAIKAGELRPIVEYLDGRFFYQTIAVDGTVLGTIGESAFREDGTINESHPAFRLAHSAVEAFNGNYDEFWTDTMIERFEESKADKRATKAGEFVTNVPTKLFTWVKIKSIDLIEVIQVHSVDAWKKHAWQQRANSIKNSQNRVPRTPPKPKKVALTVRARLDRSCEIKARRTGVPADAKWRRAILAHQVQPEKTDSKLVEEFEEIWEAATMELLEE